MERSVSDADQEHCVPSIAASSDEQPTPKTGQNHDAPPPSVTSDSQTVEKKSCRFSDDAVDGEVKLVKASTPSSLKKRRSQRLAFAEDGDGTGSMGMGKNVSWREDGEGPDRKVHVSFFAPPEGADAFAHLELTGDAGDDDSDESGSNSDDSEEDEPMPCKSLFTRRGTGAVVRPPAVPKSASLFAVRQPLKEPSPVAAAKPGWGKIRAGFAIGPPAPTPVAPPAADIYGGGGAWGASAVDVYGGAGAWGSAVTGEQGEEETDEDEEKDDVQKQSGKATPEAPVDLYGGGSAWGSGGGNVDIYGGSAWGSAATEWKDDISSENGSSKSDENPKSPRSPSADAGESRLRKDSFMERAYRGLAAISIATAWRAFRFRANFRASRTAEAKALFASTLALGDGHYDIPSRADASALGDGDHAELVVAPPDRATSD